MLERMLGIVGLGGAILVALALTGALQNPTLPGAGAAQYCPSDQYGTQYGDCFDDSTPPTISSTQSPAPNANGWNNTNVTVTFTATDEAGGSGVKSTTCSLGGTTSSSTRTFTFTTTTSLTLSCTATDFAGNVSAQATKLVRIDRIAPTITLQSRLPAPDPYGWNNTDVTVTWSCADALSGPVSPTVARTLTSNGSNQTATGSCTDQAGNNSPPSTVFNINIDKTAVPPTGGPPNDNIANATIVSTLPFTDAVDTTTATREAHEPNCAFPPEDKTVWYRLTAPQDGAVRVSLSGGSAVGRVVGVWRPAGQGLSFVTCASSFVNGPPPMAAFAAQQGQAYYIEIASQGVGTGPAHVSIESVSAPVNDAFEDATLVGPRPFADPVDLTAATVQPGEPRPSGSSQPLAASAWYRFTPAQDEKVVLGGTTAGFGPVALTVYTGNSLGALTQVAGSTGIAGGGPGSNFVMPVLLSAAGGTTYYIQLGLTFVSLFADNRFTFGVEEPVVFDGQVPAANADGWNHTDVTLNWHCSTLFMGSSFVVPVTQTLTSEGANQSATGTCFSVWAGSAADTETGINIDKTPPAIAFPHGPFPPASGSVAPPTTVDCAADPGALAPALAAAADGDVIGVEGRCVGAFAIAQSITLEGVGAATLDGQGVGPVVSVDPGAAAVVRGLTITGGSTLYNGGGVANSGTLTLDNTTVTGNDVLSGDGGGIYNSGTLTVQRSVVDGNTAWSHGGGIANDSTGSLVVKNTTVSGNGAGFAGGGIFSFGRLTVSGSTIAGNNGSVPFFSNDGGGVWVGATEATIRNSTISGNSATGSGGGIAALSPLVLVASTVTGNTAVSVGGGVYSTGALTVASTSVVGNTASTGGGIQQGGGTLDIRAATLTGNTATTAAPGSGGGLMVGFGLGTTLQDTLLAGNSGKSCGFGFGASLTDAGGNLDDGTTCGFGATSSLSNTDPLLDPAGLHDNGGPTETITLSHGSPAIDAIPAGTDGCDTTLVHDQRGAIRPQGAACDIGAVETGPAAAPTAVSPEPNANGWNNTGVEFRWTCDDRVSGVSSGSALSAFLSSEGAHQTATGTCVDLAGNQSTDDEEASLDETAPNAPTASAGRPPDYPGGAGWWKDAVTVSFTAHGDPNGANGAAGSGVDPGSVPDPVTFVTEGSHTASGTVEDLAGNESAQAAVTVHVDTNAPELSATFANADGSSYTPGTWTNQAVTATFHCTDGGGSGVASVSTPQTVLIQGANQFVVGNCSDNVGHTTTQTFGGIDIDLTPPEAYLVLDPAADDLRLVGTDQGGSGVPAGPVAPTTAAGQGNAQTRTYTVTDGAGNTLVLVLQAKPGDGAMQATVTSLRYNAGPTIAAPFTSLAFDWTSAKDGSLKSLDQDLTVGKGGAQRHVVASWAAGKNETKIVDGGSTTTRPGLVLVRVASDAGGLVIDF